MEGAERKDDRRYDGGEEGAGGGEEEGRGEGRAGGLRERCRKVKGLEEQGDSLRPRRDVCNI